MAREYFPKYSEVSHDVFDQIKAIMRGYDRLKRDRMDIIYGSNYQLHGMPTSGETGDPTSQKAVKLAYINARLEAIDQTAVLMRGLFGSTVYEDFDPIKAYWNYDYFNYQHIRSGVDDKGPAPRTWTRYKHKFAAGVAEKLNIF